MSTSDVSYLKTGRLGVIRLERPASFVKRRAPQFASWTGAEA